MNRKGDQGQRGPQRRISPDLANGMAGNEPVPEPRRLTPKGRATRERIVATAAQLMHDHGVAGTSLGDVQEAAGVGVSQVYHYFGDKDSLVRAVVAHRIQALLATLGGLDTM